METGANTSKQSTKPNPKLPYVKALRLVNDRGHMVETKEAKAFPRIAWEKMFQKKDHSPILPNHNWKFIESIPKPGNDDILLPEVTGGSEIESVRLAKEKAAIASAKAEVKAIVEADEKAEAAKEAKAAKATK